LIRIDIFRTNVHQLFVIFWATRYLSDRFDLWLIKPSIPDAVEQDLNKSFVTSTIYLATSWSLIWTGTLLQFENNRRSRNFAGEYAVGAIMTAFNWSIHFLFFLPIVVGRMDASEGIALHAGVEAALAGVALWQASTLPKLPQTITAEEEK